MRFRNKEELRAVLHTQIYGALQDFFPDDNEYGCRIEYDKKGKEVINVEICRITDPTSEDDSTWEHIANIYHVYKNKWEVNTLIEHDKRMIVWEHHKHFSTAAQCIRFNSYKHYMYIC